MLSKRYMPDYRDDAVPNPDEGWWSSVLADEEGYVSSQKEPAIKAGGQASLAFVDWEHVRSIFDQDEIVTLNVQGYNRGGLLVEEEGNPGFCPRLPPGRYAQWDHGRRAPYNTGRVHGENPSA